MAKKHPMPPAPPVAAIVQPIPKPEAEEPKLPSQLDPVSSNEDGPPSRLEFQTLQARVSQCESFLSEVFPGLFQNAHEAIGHIGNAPMSD